jgi:hypothetical protein
VARLLAASVDPPFLVMEDVGGADAGELPLGEIVPPRRRL